MRPLLIRADAGPSMGTGHVMRCLALAQAWQDAGETAEFLMASEAPAIAARLRAEGMQVTPMTEAAGSAPDATHTASRARQTGASWVVVDGYHFDAAYQESLKQAGLKVLWVDDYGHAPPYCADLVLNQNLHAEESLYAQRDAGVGLLLGPQYALLRREFGEWREWHRLAPERAGKVLVTLGGGDPVDATSKVLAALGEESCKGLESKVLSGPANPRLARLQAEARQASGKLEIFTATTDMPALMAWADVAVAAAGSTSWELAYMGLPALLVVVAEHQRCNAERLAAARVAVNLGWHGQIQPSAIAQALQALLAAREQRMAMAEAGRRVVDGRGAERVRTAMLDEVS